MSAVCLLFGKAVAGATQLDLLMMLLTGKFGLTFVFTVLFTLQLILNYVAYGWQQFWRQWWLRFDFVVVAMGWASFLVNIGPVALLARLCRLARVGKLLAKHANALDRDRRAKTFALHEDDEAFDPLQPTMYIPFRLEKEIERIQEAAKINHRVFKSFSYLAIVTSASSALYALTLGSSPRFQTWLLLFTMLLDTFKRILYFTKCGDTLQKANSVIVGLSNVRRWWNTVPAGQQTNQKTIDHLVEKVEALVQSFDDTALSALKASASADEEENENTNDNEKFDLESREQIGDLSSRKKIMV
jgi:hypothetical protein